MKISDYYTYAPKSKIKAGDANPNGKYQFYTSSPDESRRCDEYLYDCKAIVMGTGGSATLHYYDGKFSTSTDCLTLIPNEKIRAKYLYYFFLANMDVLEAGFKGAGLKHTSKGYIDNIEITKIPSLPSQDKIVNLFDELALRIEKERRQIEKLDELVKARFVEMFGGIDLAPQNKEWTKISDIGEVVSGSTPKTSIKEYWNGNICWITPAELSNMSGIIYDSKKKITERGKSSCSLRMMPSRTVILSSRAPIGKVALLGKEMCCNQGFKNIICNEKVAPEYLYYLLGYNTIFLNSLGRGATFKEISKKIVGEIKVPLPAKELQNQFAVFTRQVDKSKFVLSNELTMCDFYIRLIHDRVMHSCINLRVTQ